MGKIRSPDMLTQSCGRVDSDYTTMQGYCVKCKDKRDIADGQEVEMKGKGGTKRRAMKGKCPTCGTTMFRILPNK